MRSLFVLFLVLVPAVSQGTLPCGREEIRRAVGASHRGSALTHGSVKEAKKAFQKIIWKKRLEGVKDPNLPFMWLHDNPFGRRTFLIVHGYSEMPSGMAEQARYFYEKGNNVLVAILSGHGSNAENLLRVTPQDWFRDVREIREVAGMFGDVVGVGYSLGAAILLAESPHLNLAGLWTTAPGFARNPTLTGFFQQRKAKGKVYTSDTPADFQYGYPLTPIDGFEITSKVTTPTRRTLEQSLASGHRPLNIPTAILISLGDRVIDVPLITDFARLQDAIVYAEEGGNHWSLVRPGNRIHEIYDPVYAQFEQRLNASHSRSSVH